jgi:hypothetical protein
MSSEQENYWSKTIKASERVFNDPFYALPDEKSPYGYYDGRPIIGRNSPIDGGVYIGEHPREGLVVDSAKYPFLLENYHAFLKTWDPKIEVCHQVLQHVVQVMPTKPDVVDQVEIAANLQAEKDRADGLPVPNEIRVSLSSYLKRRGGVCRQQALYSGFVLEKMIKDSLIPGHVSVDRRSFANGKSHAWARYWHTEKGLPIIGRDKTTVKIIDPTTGQHGVVTDLNNELALIMGYRRPEDVMNEQGDPGLMGILQRLI